MVRLNKNQLSPKQLQQLFDQFDAFLVSEKVVAGDIVSELLGPEERIMLAKRLAIIVLLIEGMSLYKIAETLKVSPSTAEKTKRRLDQGSYTTILIRLEKNKKSYHNILQTLDAILHLGGTLPHYNGLDRYRGIGGV